MALRIMNSHSAIVVWDSEELPLLDDRTTILWRRFSEASNFNTVSIPELLEKNSEHLRSRYLSWVYELGFLKINDRCLIDHLQAPAGCNYWWMTLINEKSNYEKSPQIDDAIKFIAFYDWATGLSIECLELVSANQALAECLREWCRKLGVAFKWRTLPLPSPKILCIRQVYSLLPNVVQALAWLLKYLFNRWSLHGLGLEGWSRSSGKITFISYMFNLVPDLTRGGRFKSHYWGDLPEIMHGDGYKTNWLHLYEKDEFLSSSRKASNVIKDLNKDEHGLQNHVTLDTFLSPLVILSTLRDWVRLALKGWRLNSLIPDAINEPLDLWPLLAKDWQKSTFGIVGMSNVLQFNLFASAMKALPKQQVGCYLQENQGWEFGLIQAWRASYQGKLIGVPHSTVRFWDLRYYFDPRSYSSEERFRLPMPNKVAINGNVATKNYLIGQYPRDSLVQVEALRYMYFDNPSNNTKVTYSSFRRGFNLLVLGDYSKSHTNRLMLLLQSAIKIFPPGITVTVKPHPANPIDPKNYPELSIVVSLKPVAKLLAECDAAFSSATTSAAVDAYCFGVPVISILDPNILNQSPLRGFDNVYFVSTSSELAQTLELIVSNPTSVYNDQDFFIIDKYLPRWRKLLIGVD
jgi:surface carbohydrate biosynthesis protein (TIGR04326 family)